MRENIRDTCESCDKVFWVHPMNYDEPPMCDDCIEKMVKDAEIERQGGL